MKGTGELGKFEDWKACYSTLHIGHLFGPNVDQEDFYRNGSKSTLWWYRRTKKLYYEASDSVLQTGFLVGINRL